MASRWQMMSARKVRRLARETGLPIKSALRYSSDGHPIELTLEDGTTVMRFSERTEKEALRAEVFRAELDAFVGATPGDGVPPFVPRNAAGRPWRCSG